MAGVREHWEKQLADMSLSFKLIEFYASMEMVQPLYV